MEKLRPANSTADQLWLLLTNRLNVTEDLHITVIQNVLLITVAHAVGDRIERQRRKAL